MFRNTGLARFGQTFLLVLSISFSVTGFADVNRSRATVRHDVHHDVSAPLIELIQKAPPAKREQHEAEPMRSIPLPSGMRPLQEDPVRQLRTSGFTPLVSLSFEGIGNQVYGFYPVDAPPDTNGAVGASQYVQWVNTYFAIFDKTSGGLIAPPAPGDVLWLGFGGGCEANNDGDPIVLYDKLANRWVMSQFSVSTGPYLQCIAVSTTPDATGTWARYSFQYSEFDDYPKMGVWSDAYYETFQMFDEDTFLGSDACAYDRGAMLSGQPATQVCFQQNASVGGLLPADIDGSTPPPAGSPNFMLALGANALDLYKFHVDFGAPANSTFLGPTIISVAAFSPLCSDDRNCVPQPGTSTKLDSLGDRLMYRLAYRNFGDHESLVVNHAVAVNSSGGIRWYEVQAPNTAPIVAQQGTYAPDASYRWTGSIAMDKAGDVALGYSVASGAMYPSIALAGRVATDPPGALEAETIVMTGSGSQTNLSRWGDYSSMTVDPVDDCTFWYTQEYIVSDGAWNWNTRIATIKFPGCMTGSYVGFFPASLDFGSRQVGTASPSQPVSLSNHQPIRLSISSVAITGDYSQSNNCGTSLAPDATCTINITFHPTASGSRPGALTVTDDGPGSPRTTTLNGMATQSLPPCVYGSLSNADFESGTLNCWTVGGVLPPVVSTVQAHGGSFSAQLGATGMPEPDGDSSIYQMITVSGSAPSPTLSFWYWPWTDDSIDHSWQEAQIRDTNGTQLAQVFKVASNAQTWTQVTYDLTPYKGQTIQIYFNAHEDGYGDPTYMYLDDAAITDTEQTLALRLIPVTPCRVVDTRNASGTFGGPAIAANTSRDFPLPQGSCGIPSTAAAYALNVTVVPQGHLGFLTIWPSGGAKPSVSTLNSADARIKANAAIVPAGDNQAVSVFASGTTDVVLDINGYFISASNNSALAFFPLTPCRVVDTRNPSGPLGGPFLPANSQRDFPVLQATACDIPNTAQAYSFNFTAIPKDGRHLGFLSAWPAGQSRPAVSTLNAPTGTITANGAIIPAGAGGDIDAYANADTDLVIDINGYFAAASSAPSPLSLYTLQPCRTLDTRPDAFTGQSAVEIVNGPCFVPAIAQAFVLNATVVPPAQLGFLTLWPDDQQRPTASTLNAKDGAIASNMAIVPTTNGSIDAYANALTQMVLDISAYFAP